jgi:hypothetical protein
MNVDEPETAAGGPNKARETDKQRREKGEAAYNPDDDSAATNYADERVGEKRKVESGKKGGGQKKKLKSAAIIPTDSEDIPLVKAKGKAAASKASTSTAAVNKTAAKASTSAASKPPAKARTSMAAASKPAPKASTSTAAVSKTAAKASTSTAKVGTNVAKPRSSFRRYLDPSVMAGLDAMIRRGRITPEEENWYVEWTKKLSPKLRPIKGLRDNTPRAVVLMGEELTPPAGLVVTEKTCDWCSDFAPMRCFVLDQGTACLMCNIFRKRACTLNGEKVSRPTTILQYIWTFPPGQCLSRWPTEEGRNRGCRSKDRRRAGIGHQEASCQAHHQQKSGRG